VTIDEFLAARIAEDEAEARQAPTRDHLGDDRRFYADAGPHRDNWGLWTFHVPPARILAECGAKREALWWYVNDDHVVMEATIKAMAAVYSDHPDYRQEWA